MSKINNQIIDILKEQGPLLSGELTKHMVLRYGLKDGSARTRIKRALEAGQIQRSPVSFKNNSRLYFLKNQSLKRKVSEIMTPLDCPESYVFNALAVEDGFLFWEEVSKLSACSLNKISKKKSIDQLVNNLDQLKVIKIVNRDNTNDKYIKFDPDYHSTRLESSNLELRRRSLVFNKLILNELVGWLQRISLMGWNSQICDENNGVVVFNNYMFDAIGYSYIFGLYRTDKSDSLYSPSLKKAGSPILVDCIVYRRTDLFDIASFIKRIENVSGPINKNKNPYFKILPVFFVSFISPKARDLAKKKGIIIIPIEEVFGKSIIKLVESILKIPSSNNSLGAIEKALKDIKSESEAENSTSESNKVLGRFNNLKGLLFNYLVAYIFSQMQYSSPKVGVKFQGTLDDSMVRMDCECDLVVGTPRKDSVIICEVKGYSGNQTVKLGKDLNEADSVKRFFERTVNIVKSQRSSDSVSFIPIFITASKFETTAIEYMDRRLGKKLKATLGKLNNKFPSKLYYDRNDLFELTQNLDSGGEVRRVLKEYFK